MKHKFKISICMMVKNEEKNLERCLESLGVFLNDPSVELIIIDTGSIDNTVNIAQRYTSKVYFHEWNNNFSEMRNISISYAKGEWIFILDADECLENPNEAYKLLMEGNLEKYNTIQLQVKSYLYLEEDNNYSILVQPRLFRNEDNFKYDGKVHNQPKYKVPILSTDIILGHYGYITSDKELMERKFQRTGTILKKELEKDPTNIYYQFQLAVSYSMYGDHKIALNEVRKAYDMIKQKPKNERVVYVYMYGMYARISFKNNSFDETIRICKEGIDLRPDYLDLYFILANSFIKKGERSEAVKYFQKYANLYTNYNKLDISKNPAFIMYNLDSMSLSIAYFNIASYCYDYEKYDEAYFYLQKIEDKACKTALMCKVLIKLEYYDELKNYYDSLDDEDIEKQFTIILENEMKELSYEKINEVIHRFKNNDDAYGLFSRIRIVEDNKEELIRKFFNHYDINQLPIFYASIFRESKYNKALTFLYLKKINNTILKQHIGFLINEYDEMKDYFYNYLLEQSDKIRNNDFQSNRVYTVIANIILLKAMEEAKNEKRSLDKKHNEIFNLYLEKGFCCLEYKYDLKKIRIMYNTLDISEDKFLMIMYLAKEAIDSKNYTFAIKYIREALKEFPHMSMALQKYQKFVFKDI